jgi:hypothetical protein
MPIERSHLSRRAAIKTGMAIGFGLAPALAGVSGAAMAAGSDTSGGATRMDALIGALNSIGKPVCIAVAGRLAALGPKAASFDVHLRRAELDVEDARILAAALRETNGSSGPVLRSFSASYNPDLTDAGVVALAEAFPATMSELGLVGCAIGDAGGRAVLSWVRTAFGARMVCVEENDFSADVKSGFAQLSRERSALVVVV